MNRDISYKFVLLGIALLVLAGMFFVGSRQPSQVSDTVYFRPGVLVEQVSQEEWSARHWQWTLSFAADSNPGHDVTGTTCAHGQSGPVFFLPRNFAPCTIPADTAILVPVVGTECSVSEPAPFSGTSEDDLRDCAAREIERYTNIEVRIDGEMVPNIDAYRTASPLFTMVLPENNVLGAPAGPTWAVADGYQVIIKPLDPGEHEIIVHSELVDGTVLPDKLAIITIVEPDWNAPIATPILATPVASDDEP